MSLFVSLKEPIRTTPGIAEVVLIALVEWFEEDGIKSPGAWAAHGDEILIKQTHVFKEGHGFIQFSLAPEKNSYDAKSIGDTGFQKFSNEVNVFVPGSYALQHEVIKDLLNNPVIILVKDSDCPANQWYQVGTNCVYAYIASNFSTGTTKEGVKGYILTASNTAQKVYLYQGALTYQEAERELVARLDGSISGSTVTLDALDSTVSGTVTYEYVVWYNDADGNSQSVVLPETGYEAEFDTSILIDWNGAGFAVQLTLTNEFTSDTTLSSDSTGERPVIMGGFDEGFDNGFDFNI